MKTGKRILLALFVLGISGLARVDAASVDWSADVDNGIADFVGTALLPTDLLLIGTFNISDAQIQANSGNISYLMSHFAEYGSSVIGNNVGGAPGYFAQHSTGDTDTTSPFPVGGQRIYIWAFNSATYTTATQQGIFSQTALSTWVFPHQTDIPNSTSVDMTDLTDAAGTTLVAGADIVIGGFREGPLNTMDFDLALIPEPSTYALVLVGGIALLVRRRFARAQNCPR